MKFIAFLLTLASLIFSPLLANAGQVTVSLSPAKDNTLIENATGSMSCGAGASFWVGRTNLTTNYKRRAVIQFPLDSIPAYSTIISATLKLNVTGVSNTIPYLNELHAATSDWGEGTSFCTGATGVASTTNDATWIHTFYDTDFWSVTGGDYDSSVSASTSIGPVGLYSFTGEDLTQDIQYWLDNPSENFGWVLIGDEMVSQSSKIFASRENTNVALRPVLEITYQPISTTDVEDISLQISKVTASPNPSSGRTNVSFTLGQTTTLSFSVYDLRGRKIAVPNSRETFSEGVHTVSWDGHTSDGKPVAPGVYFLKLSTSGGFTKSVRISFVR